MNEKVKREEERIKLKLKELDIEKSQVDELDGVIRGFLKKIDECKNQILSKVIKI